MARTKEFDVDQALDRATELFREKGYEGATMCELVDAMGIGRQSLYDTFGDKKQLFLRAIERYTERGRASVAASLFAAEASLPELEVYFEQLVDFLRPRGGKSGCLVASAIVEVGEDDADVAGLCQGNQRKVVAGIQNALRRAVEKNEVRKDIEVDAAALFLMSQVYGMTVLARNGASKAQLRRVVEQALDSLR